MPYTEADLRAALEEYVAEVPANPNRYGEVRRRVRRTAARRTAGLACLVAFVVALAGAGITVPRLSGDRHAVAPAVTAEPVIPTTSVIPGSDPITLLPNTVTGLPLAHGGQFELTDKHRVRLTFTPKGQGSWVVIMCEKEGLVTLEGMRTGGDDGGEVEFSGGSACDVGRVGGMFSTGHPGELITVGVAAYPRATIPWLGGGQPPTSRQWRVESKRYLNSASWPDDAPPMGSWAVGVYGAEGTPPNPDAPPETWDLRGTVPTVDTPSRPVTLLPERYLEGPRVWGEQHPADGKLRRLTFVPPTSATGLTFACPRAGVWYVQRMPNGHFVPPAGCESRGPQGIHDWTGGGGFPHNDPGEPLTVEIAAFPASVPMPKTKEELARLLTNPPVAAAGVEWAIGAYNIQGYDGP